ncbi:hypothetical protein ACMCNP_04255 [Candidatus Acidulodesulfobacterium sp. H_13]
MKLYAINAIGIMTNKTSGTIILVLIEISLINVRMPIDIIPPPLF